MLTQLKINPEVVNLQHAQANGWNS